MIMETQNTNGKKTLRERLKQEVEGYSEEKKRKIVIRLLLGFAILFMLQCAIHYGRYFYEKKENAVKIESSQEDTVEEKILRHSEQKQMPNEDMLKNLEQMKRDIAKDKERYEKKMEKYQ